MLLPCPASRFCFRDPMPSPCVEGPMGESTVLLAAAGAEGPRVRVMPNY